MEDIAYLVTERFVNVDKEGNPIRRREATQILCKIESVARSEYYEAATQDLKPEITMTISHNIDYGGQKLVMYNDKLYDVLRTYWKGDTVELVLAKRIGTVEEREAVLIMPDGEEVFFENGDRLTVDY